MPQNKVYNDYLNSADIVLGMSGGEGWGLPEFHSVGLGKHAVILNATSYKEWANTDNAVMIEPSGKTEIYDNKFFIKGAPFNQGSIFDFNEDEFIAGCEKAIENYETIKSFSNIDVGLCEKEASDSLKEFDKMNQKKEITFDDFINSYNSKI